MSTVVSIIGHQGSGKTQLIERLIPLLAEQGYRVGTVKHTPHHEPADTQGKDGARHRTAGAERTLVVGDVSYALYADMSGDEAVDALVTRWLADCPLVLVEGYKRGPFPKIEVYRETKGMPARPLSGDVDTRAIVTDASVTVPDGVRVLSPRCPEDVVDCILFLMEDAEDG